MAEPDQLDAARARFPVGEEITGRVTLIPRPGTIGSPWTWARNRRASLTSCTCRTIRIGGLPSEQSPLSKSSSTGPGRFGCSHLISSFAPPITCQEHARRRNGQPSRTASRLVARSLRPSLMSTRQTGSTGCSSRSAGPPSNGLGTLRPPGARSRFVVTRHLDETRRIMLTPATTAPENKGPAENPIASG